MLVRSPPLIREVRGRQAVIAETTGAASAVNARAVQDLFITFFCHGQDLERVSLIAKPVTSARV